MACDEVLATHMAEDHEISPASAACALWQCEPLAYGLHLRAGFHCRRRGGRSVCGICVGDIVAATDGGEAL